MIRFWIAFALVTGTSDSLLAEELPAPNVPAPPEPGLFAPELPLPDLSVPDNNAPAAKPPMVVAPETLIPQPAPSPVPAPSVVVPANPNPSGTIPMLPADASPATSNASEKESQGNVPDDLKWRYKWHNGQWWYWSPATDNAGERWMIWDRNVWTPYDPATYQAPAGFAQPGPRVVNQTSNNPLPLPENYSTTEVSVPPSYYLTPSATYIAPTPYAFGASSYYGPNGPAASYYNRGSATGLIYGGSAYVPVYQGYLAPRYFSPRYTAPARGYLGINIPGYYGGRGVSIGFGF